MPDAFDRMKRQLVAAVTSHQPRPRVPEAGLLVWTWFCRLHATRTYHMAGPNPIAFAEIEAYARLHRWPMDARHVDLIRALDDAWLAHARAEAGNGSTSAPRGPAMPMSPEAFDAVFG